MNLFQVAGNIHNIHLIENDEYQSFFYCILLRQCNSAETVHPECHPIPIPPNDFFFPELNITDGSQFCFPFMRSLPGQQTLGNLLTYLS